MNIHPALNSEQNPARTQSRMLTGYLPSPRYHAGCDKESQTRRNPAQLKADKLNTSAEQDIKLYPQGEVK